MSNENLMKFWLIEWSVQIAAGWWFPQIDHWRINVTSLIWGQRIPHHLSETVSLHTSVKKPRNCPKQAMRDKRASWLISWSPQADSLIQTPALPLTCYRKYWLRANTVLSTGNQREGVYYSFEDTGTFKNPLWLLFNLLFNLFGLQFPLL